MPSSFVARFRQNKVRAVGLISSGLWSYETWSESLGCRKPADNGLVPDGFAPERSGSEKNAFKLCYQSCVMNSRFCLNVPSFGSESHA